MNEVSPDASIVCERPSVLALGFSARALAEAVVRAGLRVAAMDHFQDQDLHGLCPTLRIDYWPTEPSLGMAGQIREAVSALQGDLRPTGNEKICLLAAGGLESLPDLWHQLEPALQFCGPSPAQLLQLRDLKFLHDAVLETGILVPETRRWPSPVPEENQWLVKSTSGSGGLHVTGISEVPKNASAKRYLQRKVTGRVIGVTFVLHGDVQLLGVTESWQGSDWPAAMEYIYRGSWGPIQLSSEQVQQLTQLAQRIRSASSLRGWLQMDLIEDGDGQLWLLEINPRWTSGMEILELAGLRPLLSHLQCYASWDIESSCGRTQIETGLPCVYGKAVYYAPEALRLDAQKRKSLAALTFTSDIPGNHVDEIPRGHPVLTLQARASGGSEAAARDALLRQFKTMATEVHSICQN